MSGLYPAVQFQWWRRPALLVLDWSIERGDLLQRQAPKAAGGGLLDVQEDNKGNM